MEQFVILDVLDFASLRGRKVMVFLEDTDASLTPFQPDEDGCCPSTGHPRLPQTGSRITDTAPDGLN